MNVIVALAALLLTPEAPYNPYLDAAGEINSVSDRYRECVQVLARDVDSGRVIAREWTNQGGGAPAMHCLALADLAAGYPKLAAIRFTEISERNDAGDTLLRARLLEQAALAWRDGAAIDEAITAIEKASALAPNAGEIALSAGVIYASAERWSKTVDAITAAEEQDSISIDGFLARAKAYKALSKYRQSAEDVIKVLSRDPLNLDALVLRGELAQFGIDIAANYQRKDKKTSTVTPAKP